MFSDTSRLKKTVSPSEKIDAVASRDVEKLEPPVEPQT